jgi:transmembrane sensor
MKIQQTNSTTAIDQAIEWLERLRMSDSESEAFLDWLTDSPRHVEVFMQVMTLEQRLAAIAPKQWTTLDMTVGVDGNTHDKPTNVVPLGAQTADVVMQAIPRRRWWLAAIAASVAVLAVGVWSVLPTLSGWKDYTTSVGEQRAIQLQDSSIVELNTDSHVQVRISGQARDIRLLSGEALFKVQHDNARPFRVYAGDVTIQALGTQFDVYRQTHNTTVAVLEGRVRVSPGPLSGATTAPGAVSNTASDDSPVAPAALSAGEQVNIGHDGQIGHRSALNAAHITAWQQRRLMFDEEPLENIAFEFNRYNHKRFRIEGEDAGMRRFSGIFDADDPESLAQLLSHDSGLVVERTDNEIVIRAR